MAIYVKATISESGEIKADLPKDHPVGEVTLVIEAAVRETIPWDSEPWTQEELTEMLTPRPSTLGEILEYLQAKAGDELAHIVDSTAWVEEQRKKEEERRDPWTLS